MEKVCVIYDPRLCTKTSFEKVGEMFTRKKSLAPIFPLLTVFQRLFSVILNPHITIDNRRFSSSYTFGNLNMYKSDPGPDLLPTLTQIT